MNTPDLSQTPIAADGTFEVQLQKSGQILQVTKDQSILKVLQDAGHDVPFSCSEGICGTCSLVIDGKPHGPHKGVATCQTYMRSFRDGEIVEDHQRSFVWKDCDDVCVWAHLFGVSARL